MQNPNTGQIRFSSNNVLVKELNNLTSGSALIITSSKNYGDILFQTVSYYLKNLNKGIYVNLNKPLELLVNNFQEKGLDYAGIFFVDGSAKSGVHSPKIKNSVSVTGPSALTNISLNISSLTSKSKYDFLVFDSVSTLLLYNDKTLVAKFVKSLCNSLTVKKVILIFLILDTDTRNVDVISQFFDKLIEVGSRSNELKEAFTV